MFNLAIDSKLRGCDVVALKVEDVAPNGYAVDRATVRQKKTGQPVKFELTEQTRQAIDDYLKAAGKKPGEFLFTQPTWTGPVHDNEAVRPAGLRPGSPALAWTRTSSVRTRFGRTKATLIYRRTGNSASRAAPAWSYQD